MINRGDFPTQPASATQRARQWTAHHLYLERVWSAEQQMTGNQNDFGRFVIAHQTLALDDEQLRGFALGVNLIPSTPCLGPSSTVRRTRLPASTATAAPRPSRAATGSTSTV
jgi:hypothetical protein